MIYPSKDLRDYLRKLAGWTWNEQAAAFGHGLRLREETLTQTLLLRMAKDLSKFGLHTHMFSSDDESKNGADWEWYLRTPQCKIGFRIQAKRLYRSTGEGVYGGLKKDMVQADKLIAKAGYNNPIYVFYNHGHVKNFAKFYSSHETAYNTPSYWGCSLAKAAFVKGKASNKLDDLFAGMKPWHRLIGSAGVCDAKALFAEMAGDQPLRTRTRPPEWVDFLQDGDFMTQYLDREELGGVAYFEATDFRGE